MEPVLTEEQRIKRGRIMCDLRDTVQAMVNILRPADTDPELLGEMINLAAERPKDWKRNFDSVATEAMDQEQSELKTAGKMRWKSESELARRPEPDRREPTFPERPDEPEAESLIEDDQHYEWDRFHDAEKRLHELAQQIPLAFDPASVSAGPVLEFLRDPNNDTLLAVHRLIDRLSDFFPRTPIIEPARASTLAPQSSPESIATSPPASAEVMALAFLQTHPEWTDTQIAKAVGCDRKSLYRFKNFVMAKKIMKAEKAKFPAGSKDSKTGDLEAFDRDESETDE